MRLDLTVDSFPPEPLRDCLRSQVGGLKEPRRGVRLDLVP
jgi:hypothetical protein